MSAHTDYYDVWVCEDCYFAHSGVDENPTPDREPMGLIDESAEVTANTCLNHEFGQTCQYCGQDDDENGIQEFSWRRCEGCGSTLGGARYRLAVWS